MKKAQIIDKDDFIYLFALSSWCCCRIIEECFKNLKKTDLVATNPTALSVKGDEIMVSLIKSTQVNETAQKIFDYLNNPKKLIEICPNIIEVKDMHPLSNGGWFFTWVYHLSGIRLEGNSVDIEVIPYQRMVRKIYGGVDGKVVWVFMSESGGTLVTLKEDYIIPIPLLSNPAKDVAKFLEQDTSILLANLKNRMEH